MDRASRDELAWLAFRYVAGELTAEEEAGFEERLAEDQPAREAVDQAVELSEAVCLISAESVVASRSRGRPAMRPSLAWGKVAAACLAAVAGVSWLAATGQLLPVVPEDGRASVPRLAEPDLRDSVALVWAGLRFGQGKAPPGEVPWPPAVAEQQPVEIDAGIEDADVSVPRWLLTAFSAGTEPPRELP